MRRKKAPHTHYTKGKSVLIRIRDGSHYVGRFIERRGRFVKLDIGTFSEVSPSL